ncbi:adenylate/guanylate cyclase domain-containing protein [Nocardia sp. CDC159]|uniref:Adenylate/guanylate cyclase domain-containing protein n=1 Tax=Nocardia pulmonis TaxID=2951408 RepID=A0A9X2ED17_9NOCA|nr:MULTISPECIES: adenylate/guanylate cyclase domain-containing protein [Nocardia]MCM6776958.1 adenylate/guanylate cyclase domain-containing protein [Nocardia pulmonis]MCM6789382.1 adenylate/guanylate cyclase domain-containing protein [Nocardia sp. CDC159]
MGSPEMSKLLQSVVEPYLLDGPRQYNREQVVEHSGVPSEISRRLWVSLGFAANPDDTAIEYTDGDVAAVRNFESLGVLASAELPRQSAAARTLGQSMARLAEWQVDLVAEEIAARIRSMSAAHPEADQAEVARTATEEVVTALQQLQTYAWRRHLAAALTRSLDGGAVTGETGDTVRELAVGFADMVGYTRLTRHLDPDELSELLQTFETITTDAIASNGGWVIKNVGDEVMFAAEKAVEGARIALAIQEATAASETTPELRVGLAYGDVLVRFGDLYGSVVNMAARLTGVARPGTVLIDDVAAARLAGEPEFTLRHLRSVRVRGFSRLRSHVLRRAGR